ncbi:MAG: WD40/YVTN/BNR-like repeat-containing protein [Saprospiraceae bacterium]
MHIYILAFLLLVQSLVSCQQNPEKALLSEAGIGLQSSGACQEVPEKAKPTANNIVFKSTDGGLTWQDVSAGLPIDLPIGRVLADGGELYLSSNKGLYHSSISTEAPKWQKEISLGLEISGIFHGQTGPYVSSYEKGFFQKILGTEVLMPLHNNLKDKTVRTILETPDGTLFVGCESGLYKSTDAGNSWKQVIANDGINSIVEGDGVLICGTHKGLMRSTDAGEHWDSVLTEDGGAWNLGVIEGRFVSLTQGGDWQDDPANRVRMSVDAGKTWQRIDENLASGKFIFNNEIGGDPVRSINDIKKAGNYLFCSCDAGIFRSADWGKTWEPVFTESGLKLLQLAVSGNVIYAVKVVGC